MPLYDYGEADGRFFLVLEYVAGGTLKQRLVEPLPPHIAARLTETIARAVGYVHGRGLLHLDLKPSNILLDCEENARWDQVNPKVSDFGLALPKRRRPFGVELGRPAWYALLYGARADGRVRALASDRRLTFMPLAHPLRVAVWPPAVPGKFGAGNP